MDGGTGQLLAHVRGHVRALDDAGQHVERYDVHGEREAGGLEVGRLQRREQLIAKVEQAPQGSQIVGLELGERLPEDLGQRHLELGHHAEKRNLVVLLEGPERDGAPEEAGAAEGNEGVEVVLPQKVADLHNVLRRGQHLLQKPPKLLAAPGADVGDSVPESGAHVVGPAGDDGEALARLHGAKERGLEVQRQQQAGLDDAGEGGDVLVDARVGGVGVVGALQRYLAPAVAEEQARPGLRGDLERDLEDVLEGGVGHLEDVAVEGLAGVRLVQELVHDVREAEVGGQGVEQVGGHLELALRGEALEAAHAVLVEHAYASGEDAFRRRQQPLGRVGHELLGVPLADGLEVVRVQVEGDVEAAELGVRALADGDELRGEHGHVEAPVGRRLRLQALEHGLQQPDAPLGVELAGSEDLQGVVVDAVRLRQEAGGLQKVLLLGVQVVTQSVVDGAAEGVEGQEAGLVLGHEFRQLGHEELLPHVVGRAGREQLPKVEALFRDGDHLVDQSQGAGGGGAELPENVVADCQSLHYRFVCLWVARGRFLAA
ncbi:preprotein translocase subunit SecA [Babesia caballi]|uniref:Preprotein translocase subunit SecA n=1 Tax=Babesia caballi TaxID=5871 RepID=A0AAV4M0W4_BABCB|nr:preprotein translocase subunit SecA [Babesia caballi]